MHHFLPVKCQVISNGSARSYLDSYPIIENYTLTEALSLIYLFNSICNFFFVQNGANKLLLLLLLLLYTQTCHVLTMKMHELFLSAATPPTPFPSFLLEVKHVQS